MFKRLKGRLDRLENKAVDTMVLIADLIEDIHDDIRIRPVKDGEGTLMEFLLGEIDECPVSFQIEIKE